MTLEDYANVDHDIPSVETFENGWENQLLWDLVAEKIQTTNPAFNDSDLEDEDSVETQQEQPSITSYAEAMKLFAAEKGLNSVLLNTMSVQSALQQSFLKHNSTMRQSTSETEGGREVRMSEEGNLQGGNMKPKLSSGNLILTFLVSTHFRHTVF